MIALVTDTGCSLSEEQLRLYGITEVSSYLCFDKEEVPSRNVNYQDILDWVDIHGEAPKVLEATVEDWEVAIMQTLKTADEVLIIHSPESLTKTYINVNKAVQRVRKVHGSKVVVIDASIFGYGMGLLLIDLACKIENGQSMTDLTKYAYSYNERVFARVFLGNPEYLRKSGRLGYLASFLISLFNLKPIIGYKKGQIAPAGQAIGLDRAMNSILKETREFLDNCEGMMSVSFVYAPSMEEEAEYFRQAASEFGMNAYYDKGLHMGSTVEFASVGPSTLGLLVTPTLDRQKDY